jgi:cellobiose epimerase
MTSPSRFAIAAILLATSARAQDAPKVDLSGVRGSIDRLLREEMTNWYPRTVDRERGGFHQNLARDWSVLPDDSRSLVYQCRMTWTAAAFASYSAKDRDEYAKYAHHGIEYLDRVMRDTEHGGFHWMVGVDGKLDPKLGDEKHVYGTAFVLYAASKVYEVTGDELALKVAKDANTWLEEKARDKENGGYFEAISREGKPILSFETHGRTDRLGVYHGYKSMNSHIHLLEALAAFSRIEKERIQVQLRLREVLAIVRDKIAVEPGALNLYFTREWRPLPAHDSFGHDVETAYLLVEAAEAAHMRIDAKTWKMARSLIDHALDFGWDDEHGGFYDKGDVFAGRAYDTTKVWWTQAEGLNALLLMHAKYGGETDRYGRAFLKQWHFIQEHQLDSRDGGWFGEVTREGKLIGDGRKANPWKANYHTGRAMMNVVEMLDEIDRKAKARP